MWGGSIGLKVRIWGWSIKGGSQKTPKIMGRMGGVVMKTVVISKGVGVILVSPWCGSKASLSPIVLTNLCGPQEHMHPTKTFGLNICFSPCWCIKAQRHTFRLCWGRERPFVSQFRRRTKKQSSDSMEAGYMLCMFRNIFKLTRWVHFFEKPGSRSCFKVFWGNPSY